MAIYFVLAVFIYLYGKLYRANSSNRRRKIYLIVTFGVLILVAGLRDPSVGIDLAGHYAKRYNMIGSYSWSRIPEFSATIGYEIGYCYYTGFLHLFSSDVQFFVFVTSLIIYAGFGYFIYKESTDVVLSTEIMLFSCLYYMGMNVLRQELALSIALIAYTHLDNSERVLKDYIKFIVLILLAATFHSSAILCLLMVLFDRMRFTRKQIVIGIGVMAIFYIFYMKFYTVALNFFGTGNNYERYLTSATEGVGNINMQTFYNFLLAFLTFLLGYYVLVWEKRSNKNILLEDENSYCLARNESFMLYMALIAVAFRLLIFQMNILNRFSLYFTPFITILCPYAISSMRLSSNKKIIRATAYLLFGLYFVWITVTKATEFYGVVPYSFFW
ncbi:hypothetical protein BN3590_02692 [Clostridium sp. C105KSO15]|nr:hypothetical protein BN3590_02692 [Clostridium sp. C105KSO15]